MWLIQNAKYRNKFQLFWTFCRKLNSFVTRTGLGNWFLPYDVGILCEEYPYNFLHWFHVASLWGIVWTITKKRGIFFRISSSLRVADGLEPTTFRTTIWRSNQLNYSHHVSAFLKCGAKIGIIFNIAKNETKIFEISALFFLLVDTYIVLLEQLSRAFDKVFPGCLRASGR